MQGRARTVACMLFYVDAEAVQVGYICAAVFYTPGVWDTVRLLLQQRGERAPSVHSAIELNEHMRAVRWQRRRALVDTN